MRRFTRSIKALLRRSGITGIVGQQLPGGALYEEGWTKSCGSEKAIDREGQPIPWCTYPFIHFMAEKIRPEFRVFEYGCGHSTLWYASRVREIIAVDHDQAWAADICEVLPGDGRVVWRENGAEYINEISRHGQFDIVVVDGLDRPDCARAALNGLTPEGVIVWDNSDLTVFLQTKPVLEDSGFRGLGFVRLAPIARHITKTSILYRKANCLGI